MSNLDLTEKHENELLKFLKFAKAKRGENVREICGQFTDVQESRLLEEEYTLDDVENICANLLMVVKSSVQSELENSAQAHALMLKELMKQAQRVELNLTVDTALLDNAALLKEMVRYEELLNTPAGAARADLGGQGFVGGQKLPSMGARSDLAAAADAEKLKAENARLTQELSSATSKLNSLQVSQQSADREIEQLKKTVTALNSEDAQLKDAGASKAKEIAQMDQENTYLRRQLAEMESRLRGDGSGGATAAEVSDVVRQLSQLQSTLAQTEQDKARAEELVDAKVSESKQFQSLKKMLDKKNEVIKSLRKELAELKGDA